MYYNTYNTGYRYIRYFYRSNNRDTLIIIHNKLLYYTAYAFVHIFPTIYSVEEVTIIIYAFLYLFFIFLVYNDRPYRLCIIPYIIIYQQKQIGQSQNIKQISTIMDILCIKAGPHNYIIHIIIYRYTSIDA